MLPLVFLLNTCFASDLALHPHRGTKRFGPVRGVARDAEAAPSSPAFTPRVPLPPTAPWSKNPNDPNYRVPPQYQPTVPPNPLWRNLTPIPDFGLGGGGGGVPPEMSRDSSGSCGGLVLINCWDKTISLGKDSSPIDCGRKNPTDTSHDGEGFIGAVYQTVNTGTAVDIEGIKGMGVKTGSNKMIHLAYPFDGSGAPRKANNSLGCIHVNNVVYEQLKHCAGTKLIITGTQGPPPANLLQANATDNASR